MKRVLILILAVFYACFLVAMEASATSVASNNTESKNCVKFGKGKSDLFCGHLQELESEDGVAKTVLAFKGIKYATAGIWESPQLKDIDSYGYPHKLSQYGDMCIQANPDKKKTQKEYVGSTDCLFLNIWTTSSDGDEANKPVLFFIHGGAFIAGSGGSSAEESNLYDGAFFAQHHDVVVVTINYRLGAFGFMPPSSFNDIQSKSGGNFGIEDQVTALQWVNKHISKFGGDPNKVTIFGESAGAMSVGLHMFSMDASEGYFRAGIMQSNPMGYRYPDKNDVQDITRDFGKCFNSVLDVGCSAKNPKIDTEPTAEKVYRAQAKFSKLTALGRITSFGVPGALPFTPLINSDFIKNQPLDFDVSDSQQKPLVFGFNQNEGVLFAGLARGPEVLGEHIGLLAVLGGFNKGNIAGCDTSGEPDNLNLAGYQCLVKKMFGEVNVEPVIKQGSNDYNPTEINGVVPSFGVKNIVPRYAQQSYTAMANLITDFAFACPNIKAPSATTDNPVWGYLFNQSTVMASQPDVTACDKPSDDKPSGDNFTCHEAELPFVFHNRIPSDDLIADKVSRQMNDAWAAFARDPYSNQPPMEGWKLWKREQPNKTLLSIGSGGTILRPSSAEQPLMRYNCSFWDTIKPIAK